MWKSRREALHGGKRRWKILSLVAIFLVFALLVRLLIFSVSLDPVIPVIIIVALILLIPIAVFLLDLCYCDAM